VNAAAPLFRLKGYDVKDEWTLARKQTMMCSLLLPIEHHEFNRLHHLHRKDPTDASRDSLRDFRRSMIDKLNVLIASPASLQRALAAAKPRRPIRTRSST
jgi:hypothetical protein